MQASDAILSKQHKSKSISLGYKETTISENISIICDRYNVYYKTDRQTHFQYDLSEFMSFNIVTNI